MEITEEQRQRWKEDKESWTNEAKTNIHTTEDLKNFANKLIEHCSKLEGTDCYEETANATTALAHAAVEMCAYQFGLTGFQVSYIMWGIIDKLIIEEHDCGLRMFNYSNMLYPQYENHFEKTIDKETWKTLQEKAKKRYEENEKELEKLANGDKHAFPAHPDVAAHWKSIIDGKIPFGYKVK